MKKRLCACLCVATLLLSSCAFQSKPEDTIEKLETAFNNYDVEAVLECYEPSVQQVYSGIMEIGGALLGGVDLMTLVNMGGGLANLYGEELFEGGLPKLSIDINSQEELSEDRVRMNVTMQYEFSEEMLEQLPESAYAPMIMDVELALIDGEWYICENAGQSLEDLLQGNGSIEYTVSSEATSSQESVISDSTYIEGEVIDLGNEELTDMLKNALNIHDRELYESDVESISTLTIIGDFCVFTTLEEIKTYKYLYSFYQTLGYRYILSDGSTYYSDNIDYGNLKNLVGLEKLTNLEQLTIIGQENLDLKGLSDATQLKKLILDDNGTIEHQRVGNLVNLEYLRISDDDETWNGYSDSFSSFSNLTKLTHLELISHERPAMNWFMQGEYDLSFISQLTNLEYLEISGFVQNGGIATDYDNVHFTNLQSLKHIAIDGWIGSLDRLLGELMENGGIYNLEYLDICDGKYGELSDNAPLASASNLKTLRISLDGDLSYINNLVALESLVIYDTNHMDCKVIGNLSNLQYLSIEDGLIDDYSFISNLKQLKTLNLCASASFIETILPLVGAESLEKLYIGDVNGYSSKIDLTGIDSMRSLKKLVLFSCYIQDHSLLDNVDWIEISESDLDQVVAWNCTFGFENE